MISGFRFKEYWEKSLSEYEDGLVCLDGDLGNENNLPVETYNFLVKFGLPNAAAPYLNFATLGDEGLKRIYEVWGNPNDFDHQEKKRLANFLIIGSDGSGNPIAINTLNNFIVHLDHDERFEKITFVNSSIFQLAEYLLEVRKTISLFNNSDDSRNNNHEMPKIYKTNLLPKLIAIDSPAINKGTFWESEIAML